LENLRSELLLGRRVSSRLALVGGYGLGCISARSRIYGASYTGELTDMEERIDALDQYWKEEPEVIRAFLEARPLYEELAGEVSFSLAQILRGEGIECASLTGRAKTLRSFCEKAVRKNYKHPLAEMTDIAGVRVVYLYLSELDRIKQAVEDHFEVIEKVDKVEEAGAEEFGYAALHYAVRLGDQVGGPRYDKLRVLPCEIQVRSVAQDAWAVVAHHLVYKQESDVPKDVMRELNALSGLLESADHRIASLRQAKLQYQKEFTEMLASNRGDPLGSGLDLDNLTAYLQWRFPDRHHGTVESVGVLLDELQSAGYSAIRELHEALAQAEDVFARYERENPPAIPTADGSGATLDHQGKYADVGAVRAALSIVNPHFVDIRHAPERSRRVWRKEYAKYRKLLKDGSSIS